MSDDELIPLRPRFGTIHRVDGTRDPVVFHPDPEEKNSFYALHPSTEEPVTIQPGDQIHVDIIGPGQKILIRYPNKTRNIEAGATRFWKKERQIMVDNENKNSNSPIKSAFGALAVLAGLSAIILGTLAGIKAIF